MGTNYYLYKDVCKVCGRGSDPIHIGKSSAGWCFHLHIIQDESISDLPDWEKLWNQPNIIIKDEYGEIISIDEMKKIITNRKWPKKDCSEEWYKQNGAERGPNNLARSRIDGHYCVGHGDGTWDLAAGEFS
jgi:hypothetical protein